MRRISPIIYRSLVLLAGVFLLGFTPSFAQVTVSLPDVTGEAGTSETIPITVGDLTGQDVLSYEFTLTYDAAVIDIETALFAGTLSDGAAQTTINTSVAGQITVAYARNTALSGAGTLVLLDVTYLAVGNSGLTLANFQFNEGVPAATVTNGSVIVPQIALRAPVAAVGLVGTTIDLPITTEMIALVDGVESYVFTIAYDATVINITGASVNGTCSEGYSVQVNTVTPGRITVAAGGTTALVCEADHALINLQATLINPGTSALTFVPGSVLFNEGIPIAGGINGTVIVSANAAPVFTQAPLTATIFEEEVYTADFAAVDPDGGAITLTLTVGAGVPNVDFVDNGDGTGNFVFSPDITQDGVYNFTVQASDGLLTTDAPLVVTVNNYVLSYEATLNGVNVIPLVMSGGNGYVWIDIDADMLMVGGWFQDLGSAVTIAHLHTGGVGEMGGSVIPLDIVADPGSRSGWLSAMVDLTTVTYPDGLDAETFKGDFEMGLVYVNVHSGAYPAGEVRGQVVQVWDDPPEASAVTWPVDGATYMIEGDPTSVMGLMTFSEATDPDGDTVLYIWQMATDEMFLKLIGLEYFIGQTATLPVTVNDAAELYDMVTRGYPGAVVVGGTIELYERIITSDGSEWTIGPVTSFMLTRGSPTAIEDEGLPTEFVLDGNYPNPFNPSTTIQFDLPETAEVSVQVVDMLGREVMSVPVQAFTAGANRTIQLNASSLASGTYLYRLVARTMNETLIQTGRMTLLK